MYGKDSADNLRARRNFVESMAAYSIIAYIMQASPCCCFRFWFLLVPSAAAFLALRGRLASLLCLPSSPVQAVQICPFPIPARRRSRIGTTATSCLTWTATSSTSTLASC